MGKVPAGLAKYMAAKKAAAKSGVAHPTMKAKQFAKGGGRKGK